MCIRDRKKGFAEMLRAIREDEPSKPSTRISTLGETGTKTAQQRRVDAKKLGSLLRGDVDWIVMKCLEKDRNRRYETASGLAADIQRHLNDEPVTAGAPSATYRLSKFIKRNRIQVLAGGAVMAALLLGCLLYTSCGRLPWHGGSRGLPRGAAAPRAVEHGAPSACPGAPPHRR